MSVPDFELFRYLVDKFGIGMFVETGTCYGDTIAIAANIFKHAFTIELSDDLYLAAKERFGNKAECIHGKSDEVLRQLLPRIGRQPVVFWLDAHYSGGPAAGKEEQCPLLKELMAINDREGNYDFIFIDDAHSFLSPLVLEDFLDVDQFPNITQIILALNRKDRYVLVYDDKIVAVPTCVRKQICGWLRSNHRR